MARKTKEQAAETRNRILDAAVLVFHEKGVAKARFQDIAAAAGVTRGAIYWHFENKLSLFKALHDRFHVPFIQQMLDGLESTGALPLEQLERLSTALLIDLEQNDQKRRTLSLFLLKCDYTGELAPFLAQQAAKKAVALDIFARYFSKAAQAGHLPQNTDEKLLALSFSCYLSGIVSEYLRAPGNFSLAREAKGLMHQFFKSVDVEP